MEGGGIDNTILSRAQTELDEANMWVEMLGREVAKHPEKRFNVLKQESFKLLASFWQAKVNEEKLKVYSHPVPRVVNDYNRPSISNDYAPLAQK